MIGQDTDILIAHNPAKGYVDDDHGCESSALMVAEKLPRIYICGHVHSARGATKVGSVLFVNGANVSEKKGAALPASTDEAKGLVRGAMKRGERSYLMQDEGRPIVVEV